MLFCNLGVKASQQPLLAQCQRSPPAKQYEPHKWGCLYRRSVLPGSSAFLRDPQPRRPGSPAVKLRVTRDRPLATTILGSTLAINY